MVNPDAPRRTAGSPPPLGDYDADIIILALNRLEDTVAAINSALSQYGGVFHVTVLDQGSPPEMRSALRRQFGGRSNFALYESPQNLGVPGGRVAASTLGHGQIIVALDNDAEFENTWIVANTLRRFRQAPDLAAIGYRIMAADGVRPDLTSWGYPKAMLPRFRERFDTTTFVGAGHAIRRAAWTAAGGYDAGLFFAWEEYDFCLNAIALNWRIAYDGTLGIIHKVSPEARISWSGQRMEFFVRNRLLIGRKWGETRLAQAPRILGYMLRAMRAGCLRGAWQGVKSGIGPAAPRKRHMPQAMRHYIMCNETHRRGSWLARFRLELFGRITP